MNRYRAFTAILSLALGGVGALPAFGQFSPGPTGTAGTLGTGSVTIERQPNLLRLQLLVTAEGKDTKEAIANLKEKEAAAREKLAKLGAAEASVAFADPQPQDANQRQQMERMIQLRGGGSPRAKVAQPTVMTLSTTLKAEWPLTGKDGDEVLSESIELQTKIKSADLAGQKMKKTLTPEQEEIAEENQSVGNNDGQPNPRDPVFLYVSKISAEERQKAQAEAFKKAKEDAGRLAKAAGIDLGPIRMLAGTASPALPSDRPPEMYDVFQQRIVYNMINRTEGDDTSEAIGSQPGKVGYRVTVYVSFALAGS